MIDRVFCKGVAIERFRSAPVVGSVLDRCVDRLIERGFADSTVKEFVRRSAEFGVFLSERNVALTAVDENQVGAYLRSLCRARDVAWPPPAAIDRLRYPLRLLVCLLREEGVIPAGPRPFKPSRGPHGAVLDGFIDFLRAHRGLSIQTRQQRERYVGRFLRQIGALPLGSISAEQIDRYLIVASQTIHRRSIKGVCAALRSFLHYLCLLGLVPRDLSSEVATPRIYRQETTPRSIAWSEIHRLLEAIDRTTATGCRDYALLLLLVVYGLRACEVARLSLEDFDWERPVLRIDHAKGGGRSEAPLHPEVTAAVVEYLRRIRPRSSHRALFLTLSAPVRPLAAGTVTGRVRACLLRAGVTAPHFGSHTLRHSLAIELLRKGFSLKAIGDLLGHRSPESTFIYAKAAIEDLRGVALDPSAVLS